MKNNLKTISISLTVEWGDGEMDSIVVLMQNHDAKNREWFVSTPEGIVTASSIEDALAILRSYIRE